MQESFSPPKVAYEPPRDEGPAETRLSDQFSWHLLGVIAAWITAASGVLFFVGNAYLEAKYHRVALLPSQIGFAFPAVVAASFFPLLYPLGFLAFVAVLCINRAGDRYRLVLSPFYPIPAAQVIAIVFSLWSVKRFLDAMSGLAPVRIWSWAGRDLLLLAIGSGLLFYLYRLHLGISADQPAKLSPSTKSGIASFGLLAIASFVSFHVSSGEWPLSTIATLLLFPIAGFLMIKTWGDFRKWRRWRSGLWVGPPVPLRTASSGERASSNLFLWFIAVIGLLLSAGMAGMVSSERILDGCENFVSVSFDPTPEQLDASSTYWLIHHEGGLYYVRQIQPMVSDETLVVPEEPGMVAVVQNHKAWDQC